LFCRKDYPIANNIDGLGKPADGISLCVDFVYCGGIVAVADFGAARVLQNTMANTLVASAGDAIGIDGVCFARFTTAEHIKGLA
jgi:hypothetical protein